MNINEININQKTEIVEEIKRSNKKNFLGMRTIIKDIRDLPSYYHYILIACFFLTTFLSFFDINHFINSNNNPSIWTIKNQITDLRTHENTTYLGNLPNWVAPLLYSLSGITSFTGLLNVLLVAFGKTSNYFWGVLNVIVTGLFSFGYGYFGEAQLNLLIYLPFQFIGWYMWEKSINNKEGSTVTSRKSNSYYVYPIMLLFAGIISIAWYYEVVSIYPFLIKNATYDFANKKQWLPHSFDSIENALGIVGIVCQSLRLKEQWLAWIVTDVIMIVMYSGVSSVGSGQGVSINLNIIIEVLGFIALCIISWMMWYGKLSPDYDPSKKGQKSESKLILK